MTNVSSINPQRKLAMVVSSDMTIKAFLLRHLRVLGERCELSVIANTTDMELLTREGIKAQLCMVPIERPIRPWGDLRALCALSICFFQGRYRGVVSITPKAGLLSMLAAFIVRTPVRIHIFTGQVWATRSGFARRVFKFIDRLMARLATHVLVDGEPQRQFLIAEGVLHANKSRVLGSGSLSGVDAERFRPDADSRKAVRKEMGIAEDALLFLYVGRLNRDKGILDLAVAFARLAPTAPNVHLLMVGPDEADMRPLVETACAACRTQLHFVGYTAMPEHYMTAADVFCLPSYREGFPTSVLEAAASGIPAITSRIYGLADAVVEGVTGLFHAPGNVDEIFTCMRRMADLPEQRVTLGSQARQRALSQFSAMQVTDALCSYVLDRLDEAS